MRIPLHYLVVLCVLSVYCFSGVLAAGDAPATTPAKPKEPDALAQIAAEEKWVFEPQINRKDVFYDLEAILSLPTGDAAVPANGPLQPNQQGVEIDALKAFAKNEVLRVEAFVMARKWDDALKSCEADIKKLQAHAEDTAIQGFIAKLKRYQQQADEAKIYEEAQAKFDALGLKVEGILWSPTGSLAVISGEPRARAINDRVKDCVIINIDTNRVDFLFHNSNRQRFEFQRYVGEDMTTGPKSK